MATKFTAYIPLFAETHQQVSVSGPHRRGPCGCFVCASERNRRRYGITSRQAMDMEMSLREGGLD